MHICGIDEAGRGCIIGPLVICGAMIDENEQPKLKEMGVKDSKLLSEHKREQLAAILPKHVRYQIIIVPPSEIDEYVLSETGENLNWLEAQKSVELINMLNPEKVILDSPSPNLKAYKSYVAERLLHKAIDIVVEHKADLNHPIVAAASILAKSMREEEIRKLKEEVGDFGSGYLTDPKTKIFLEKNWEKWPGIFRKSWAPYQALIKKKLQKKIGEY